MPVYTYDTTMQAQAQVQENGNHSILLCLHVLMFVNLTMILPICTSSNADFSSHIMSTVPDNLHGNWHDKKLTRLLTTSTMQLIFSKKIQDFFPGVGITVYVCPAKHFPDVGTSLATWHEGTWNAKQTVFLQKYSGFLSWCRDYSLHVVSTTFSRCRHFSGHLAWSSENALWRMHLGSYIYCLTHDCNSTALRPNMVMVHSVCVVRTQQISRVIIQHIVTLPKYGHSELDICRPHMTDILRYT